MAGSQEQSQLGRKQNCLHAGGVGLGLSSHFEDFFGNRIILKKNTLKTSGLPRCAAPEVKFFHELGGPGRHPPPGVQLVDFFHCPFFPLSGKTASQWISPLVSLSKAWLSPTGPDARLAGQIATFFDISIFQCFEWF